MAALSAQIKGVSKIMAVDTHQDRLKLAQKRGAIPIDDSDNQSAEKMIEVTGGEGADRGCECIGHLRSYDA
jgi:glutathione-independent formaldehyde dehydrogenase